MWRRSLAVALIAALFLVCIPSASLAGGCDDPGYTGGSCNKSSTGPVQPPGGGKGHAITRPDFLRDGHFRSWLVNVILRLLR